MSTSTVNKQELIDWIIQLEDQAKLESIKLLKESLEEPAITWEDLPEAAKEGIEQGLSDAEAGRVHSSEEFWEKVRPHR